MIAGCRRKRMTRGSDWSGNVKELRHWVPWPTEVLTRGPGWLYECKIAFSVADIQLNGTLSHLALFRAVKLAFRYNFMWGVQMRISAAINLRTVTIIRRVLAIKRNNSLKNWGYIYSAVINVQRRLFVSPPSLERWRRHSVIGLFMRAWTLGAFVWL